MLDAIEAEKNAVEPVIDAVKVYATMGEIMSIFEDQYGTYRSRSASPDRPKPWHGIRRSPRDYSPVFGTTTFTDGQSLSLCSE